MDTSIMVAYAEVDEIINLMDKQYQEKIPLKLRLFIAERKLKNYKVIINQNLSLKEQKLSKKALAILAVLNYKYWCNSEEEKEKLIKKYERNEKKYQEELKERYNIDDLFKNRILEQDNEIIECKQLVQYKERETFFKNIINKIKKWFRLT